MCTKLFDSDGFINIHWKLTKSRISARSVNARFAISRNTSSASWRLLFTKWRGSSSSISSSSFRLLMMSWLMAACLIYSAFTCWSKLFSQSSEGSLYCTLSLKIFMSILWHSASSISYNFLNTPREICRLGSTTWKTVQMKYGFKCTWSTVSCVQSQSIYLFINFFKFKKYIYILHVYL